MVHIGGYPMTKLLITGSRDASKKMLEYAYKLICIAEQKGWSVIVGDANGIDAYVIAQCDIKSIPVEVHGAYNILRHSSIQRNNITHPCTYPVRDQLMAELCDVCVGIWNGTSRGTKMTVDFARKLGKKTYLVQFDD
jgi:hypothetical protein